MPEIRWIFRRYDELSLDDLYDILALRQRVFGVEQNCAYLDVDGRDRSAFHLFTRDATGRLVGYLRLFAPGSEYRAPYIGRVVTHPDVRRTGLGRALMAEGIRRCGQLFPNTPIAIKAQRRLERFYSDLGFRSSGAPFYEDGIEHVPMLRETESVVTSE